MASMKNLPTPAFAPGTAGSASPTRPADIAEVQTMLDARYEEIKNGKVKLIPGDEAFARLRQRIKARSAKPAATGLEP